MSDDFHHIRAGELNLAFEDHGARNGVPVFLMHGWPYDPRCYDAVVPLLAGSGCRVIVPYLRGFGATRLEMLLRLRLPMAVPVALGALGRAFGYALVGVGAADILAGSDGWIVLLVAGTAASAMR